MKLVQFFENPSHAPGGTEKMMERIAEVASSLGYECEEVFEKQYSLRAVSQKFTMLNPLGNICQMSWLARRRLRAADVIISHGIYGPFLRSTGRIHVLHSTHSGTADAMRPHIPGLDFQVARYLWGGLFERVSLQAQHCVAVSNFVVDQARQYYGKHCRMIPNTVSSVFRRMAEPRQYLRDKLGLPRDKRVVMVVGRRERLKGWRLVEGMVSHLPDDVILLSVGEGPGVEHENLILHRAVAPEQLVEYYNAVDWVLCPSLYEGFGLTLLEAWQCGTPVIATPTGVALDFRGRERTFDLCLAEKTDSQRALLDALLRGLEQSDGGSAQVGWGQAVCQREFSRDRFRAEWSSLLTSKGPRRTGPNGR